MNVHHVLLFCVLSALHDGNTGLVGAYTFDYTEGDSMTIKCPFEFSGRKKYLCRDECEEGDILIATEGDRAKKGRYSISYEKGTFPVSSTFLNVTIRQLTLSDSGRYRCGLERSYFPDAHWEFGIRVKEGRTLPLPLVVLFPVLIVFLLYKYCTGHGSAKAGGKISAGATVIKSCAGAKTDQDELEKKLRRRLLKIGVSAGAFTEEVIFDAEVKGPNVRASVDAVSVKVFAKAESASASATDGLMRAE